MDTKSIKFRNGRVLKTFLVLLACTSTFLTCLSVFKIIYYNSNYCSIDFNDIISGNYSSSYVNSRSTAFSKEMLTDLSKISKMVNEYKSDENVENGTAFTQKENELKVEMEKEINTEIINAKKKVIEENSSYNYDKEEYEYDSSLNQSVNIIKGFNEENQAKADANGITTINGEQYYEGYPLSAVTVDEATIRKNKENEYKDKIANEKLTYTSDYKDCKNHLASLENLKFSVYNRNTGEIYTNIKGAEATPINSLQNKNNKWYMLVQNGSMQKGSAVDSIDYYRYTSNGNDLITLSDVITGDFNKKGFDIYISINNDKSTIVQGDNYYSLYKNYVKGTANIKIYLFLSVIAFLMYIILTIILAVIAGRVDEQGNTILLPIDKLLNDFHLIFSLLIVIGLISAAGGIYDDAFSFGNNSDNFNLSIYGISLLFSAASVFFIEWLMSVVRNARNKKYFKNTFIWFIIKKFKNLIDKIKGKFEPFYNENIKKQIYFIIIGYFASNFILLALTIISMHDGSSFGIFTFLLLLALNIYFYLWVRGSIKALDNMTKALVEAEKGDFDFNLDVYSMPKYLRPFATQINNLRNGIKIAVDDAVRGERMKTDLITNVSHDLKTPLTSIIAYVDLLKMCDIKDKTALQYIDVLDDKSSRLKTLIEDLVEASKASSGNMTFNITKVNLNELAMQLMGENEEDLKSLDIELIANTQQEAVIVKADGQKTYRAIENLFSNVKKYALPGTRVYVDVTKDENYGIITVKNISKTALGITAEELTQRFVRGDESRAGEGSGLGLSIAKSLVSLQNGDFKIEIDGDLFKATIRLPID